MALYYDIPSEAEKALQAAREIASTGEALQEALVVYLGKGQTLPKLVLDRDVGRDYSHLTVVDREHLDPSRPETWEARVRVLLARFSAPAHPSSTEASTSKILACPACGQKNGLPLEIPAFGSALICSRCKASLIQVSSPGERPYTTPQEVARFFGYKGCSLLHAECPLCGKINYSVVVPEKGYSVSFWWNCQQENPNAAFVVSVNCPHCEKPYVIEWDEDPRGLAAAATPLHKSNKTELVAKYFSLMEEGFLSGGLKSKTLQSVKDMLTEIGGARISANTRHPKTSLTLLDSAAMVGDPEVVTRLLALGADVNLRTHTDRQNTTPLIIAAVFGHPKIVRVLLDAGADMNAQDSDGNTALALVPKALEIRRQSGASDWEVHEVERILKEAAAEQATSDKTGAASASPKHSPESEPPMSPGSYVESVFAFDAVEEHDLRNWQQMADIRDVPRLLSGNNLSEAERLIEEGLRKYPRYEGLHFWRGQLWEKKGRVEKARESYETGIKASKSRASLCGRMALLEFKHGSLPAAVRWWIRSALLQLYLGRVTNAPAFLYLSSIASRIGKADDKCLLLSASAKGPRGGIGLDEGEEQRISERVRNEGSQEIREAIRVLTTKYWREIASP